MKKFPRVIGCVGVLMAIVLFLAVSPSFGVDDEPVFVQQDRALNITGKGDRRPQNVLFKNKVFAAVR